MRIVYLTGKTRTRKQEKEKQEKKTRKQENKKTRKQENKKGKEERKKKEKEYLRESHFCFPSPSPFSVLRSPCSPLIIFRFIFRSLFSYNSPSLKISS